MHCQVGKYFHNLVQKVCNTEAVQPNITAQKKLFIPDKAAQGY